MVLFILFLVPHFEHIAIGIDVTLLKHTKHLLHRKSFAELNAHFYWKTNQFGRAGIIHGFSMLLTSLPRGMGFERSAAS
jgi:hypothetical protein